MPINIFLDFIFGNEEMKIAESDTEKCLNLLHKNKITCGGMKKSEDGYFFFTLRLSKVGKVKALLDKSGIKVYSIRGVGLPFLIKRYRKRYGILVGALIFCMMLWVSRLFVWEVSFSGNENIPDSEVENQLLEAGFGVGTYIPKVNFYSLCNLFLRQTEDFSFVSVNMEGTTAKVELRERMTRNEEEEYEASNLVAKYSGQIDSMTVYSGDAVIEKEAVVKEGELLVSGFLEKSHGFEIVRSRGSVYAYVTRLFEVEIPFEKTVKVYTGRETKDIDLSFFGKNINIYSTEDNSFESFDSRKDRERLVLFDKVRLPLILTSTVNKEYEYQTLVFDERLAREEAEKELTRIMLNELGDSEVLERRITEEVTDTSYKISCSVYCLTDIALEKEILLK